MEVEDASSSCEWWMSICFERKWWGAIWNVDQKFEENDKLVMADIYFALVEVVLCNASWETMFNGLETNYKFVICCLTLHLIHGIRWSWTSINIHILLMNL